MTAHSLRSTFVAALGVTCIVTIASADIMLSPSHDVPTGVGPSGVTAGDFDNDGDMDLATTAGGQEQVKIMLNDGAGNFVSGPSTMLPNSSSPGFMVTADFDGDGNKDVALAVRDGGGCSDSAVMIMLNTGSGSFTTGSVVCVGDRVVTMAVDDVNGDGFPDLAVANRNSGDVALLINLGNGTFSTTFLTVPGEPRGTAFGDLDGDGDKDLIVTDHDSRTIVLFRNNGGVFTTDTTLSVGTAVRPDGVDAKDLDGDGDIDITVVSTHQPPGDPNGGAHQASVLLNNGAGFGAAAFTAPVDYPTAGTVPTRVMALDMDRDGARDLVVMNSLANEVAILRNTGNGTFEAALDFDTAAGANEMTAADFNGDGAIDIAVSADLDDVISVLMNETLPVGPVCPADTNGDITVDVDDLISVILAWGSNDPAADITGDGTVDVDDLVGVILAWGDC